MGTLYEIHPMTMRLRIVSLVCSVPLIMVLCTVFAVAPELENGTVSGKYVWFYFSMAVAAAVPVGIVLTSSNPRPFRVDAADVLILLYGLVSFSTGYWLNHSESITKHILLALVILLYFCFKTLFRSNRQTLYPIVVFFLATGLIESVWGLLQLYGFALSQHSRFRLTGSFFNPGPYACYIATVMPCAFYYLLRHWATCTKVHFKLHYGFLYLRWGIALLTVTAALLVLPAAMSRTSWLAGLGGCGWVGVTYLFKSRKVGAFYRTHKKQCLFLVSCLLVFALLGSKDY